MPRKRAKKDPTPIIAQEKQIISKILPLSDLNISLWHIPLHVIIIMANKRYLCQGLNITLGDVINICNGMYDNSPK